MLISLRMGGWPQGFSRARLPMVHLLVEIPSQTVASDAGSPLANNYPSPANGPLKSHVNSPH